MNADSKYRCDECGELFASCACFDDETDYSFPQGLTPKPGDDDYDYGDDLADAMTPDEMWSEGGIKD